MPVSAWLQYSTVQYSTVQFSTVQYSVGQHLHAVVGGRRQPSHRAARPDHGGHPGAGRGRGRGRGAGRVGGVQHAVALDHAVAGLVGRGAPLEVEAGRGQREALHLLWRGFRR